METETEKKSYDIKQAEEVSEQKTESYEPISEDSALLEKTEPEEEKPVETADETTALTEKANLDPEDLTKKEPSSQTLKGRFLQLFDRKKPNNAEPAAVELQQNGNGDTPHTPAADPPQTTTKKPFLPPIKIPIKLKNPFMKKSESSTPIASEENTENVGNPEPATETDEKDGAEATEVPAAENCDEKKGKENKLAISSVFLEDHQTRNSSETIWKLLLRC